MQFITEQADYDAMLQRVSLMINLRSGVPAQVFWQQPQRVAITEFDLLWDEAAWRAFAALATYYGDRQLLMMVNAPDGPDWVGVFGHHGAAAMPVNATGAEYVRLIWDPTGEPVRPGAERLTILSPSGGFALWAGVHAGLAVIGMYDEPGCPAARAPFLLHELSLDESLAILNRSYDGGLPEEVADQMQREYGPLIQVRPNHASRRSMP